MAVTAALHVDQRRPELRLVRPPLDVQALATRWETAFAAADRALAAAAPSLQSREISARRNRLALERRQAAAELGRLIGILSGRRAPFAGASTGDNEADGRFPARR
jgi:anti-sigma-K factor RskA